MNHPYRKLAFPLFIALCSFLFTAGCNQKAEKAAEPVETKKLVRVAGVMSAEGAEVPESELKLIYDPIKASLGNAGILGRPSTLVIEVFILRMPESGRGEAILKVHSETSKEVVAETLLEFTSAEELAAKVADYLMKV